MKTAVLALLSLLCAGDLVQAQTTPFDMTPERGASGGAAIPNAPPVVTPQPPATAAPQPRLPASGAQASPQGAAATPATAAADLARRYIIPNEALKLSGEIDSRSWSIYLTPEQAASPARFHIGYQNSVVVAPEHSRLSVSINNSSVVDEDLRASDAPVEHSFEIPAGVLLPGSNLVRFQSSQRHRTDCTLESTYDLWTDINPSMTFLSFRDAGVTRSSRLDDIRAIGVDGKGATKFTIVVPALEQLGTSTLLLRLSQGLGLLSNMPNQSFSFVTSVRDANFVPTPGQLLIFVGTPAELRPALGDLPNSQSGGAIASFIRYPGAADASALLLSGPTWASIDGLVGSLAAPTDGVTVATRKTLSTQAWHPEDTVLVSSDTTLSFSQLGVDSQEFSGRLFRTSFAVGIPADFYAEAYGEAQVLLDAAYTSQVLPGSHVDVYVNGSIASTLPINTGGGGVFRKLPIDVTMRHFRPGFNLVVIEAALQTAEDTACLPGASASDTPRFALFDTSQFHIPDFARIAQTPNLAALAGMAFPYGESNLAVPLFMDRLDEDTLSAAATFLGKISKAAQRVIPVDVTMSAATINGQNALFFGSISQMPPMVLSQFGIADSSRTGWTASAGNPDGTQDVRLDIDNWDQVAGTEGQLRVASTRLRHG
jgi:hypothetical protein